MSYICNDWILTGGKMEILFNQYGNMEEISLYLCNPNRDEIDIFEASNRAFTLRFNDLSEFTCEVSEEYAHYDLVETKRLIYAEHIGWFQIIKVDENDDGVHKTKTVTAESHQTGLKNFGFTVEERTYCFYNADDKYDANYDASNDGAVPSIVGQLYRQAGIKCELSPSYSEFEPVKDYEDWTIIYIASSLIGRVFEKSGIYRSFNKGNKYVYEFMNTDVSDAFQVIFDFDILHHAIKIKTANEITERTSIYLTHENLIQAIDVNENAEDIVTVLDCKGTNLDITLVNPMGTNYIVDFSYYMMEKDGHCPWMTKPLIDALTEWKSDCYSEENISNYSQLTQTYSEIYGEILPYEEELQYNSLKSKDIGETRDDYAKGALNENSDFMFGEISISYTKDDDGELQATVDRVEIYKNSASYYKTSDGDIRTKRFTFYNTRPTSNGSGGFNFSGASETAMTLDEAFAALNITEQSALDDGEINIDNCYKYFKDDTTNRSYCELKGAAIVDGTTGEATYRCGGYKRICLCMYAGESVEAYIDRNNDINTIVGDKDDSPSKYADNNQPTSPSLYYRLNSTHEQMREISETVSLVNYFSDKEDLYRELKCYWVEGEYTDEHLSAEDTTTIVEQIKLARELMNNGFDELEKVCQPKFSFSISLVNFIKIYKYRHFTQELALGKIITIQKDDEGDGIHYYPALTELSFNLDNSDDFTLTFSNAYKMNDWGYTFSDLLAKSSSISRQVASNWETLTKYANEKEDIMSLVNNSLDSTLRAANSNLFAQEFIIDETGIIGRQFLDESHSSFADEQIRIMNNLIMITADKWQTIKTALGKTILPNGEVAYGLVADTIIGKMIIGESLLIGNDKQTVEITGDGISISQGSIRSNTYEHSDESSHYADRGITIEIGDEPYIRTPSFAIESSGDAYFRGNIEVLSLTSDNFSIASDGSISCSNIVISNGTIQTSDFRKKHIVGDTFSGEVSKTITPGRREITTITSGAYATFECIIQGSITVDGACGILSADRAGMTYTYNGEPGYSPVRIEDENITFSEESNEIRYKLTVITGSHPYSSGMAPSKFAFNISYTAFTSGGEMAAAGAMIKMDESPAIIFENFSLSNDGSLIAKKGKIGEFYIDMNENGASSPGSFSTENLHLSAYGRITAYEDRSTGTYSFITITGGGISGNTTFNNSYSTVTPDYALDKTGLSFNPDSGAKIVASTADFQTTPSILSDRHKKKDIEEIGEEYSDIFDELKPVKYRYINGTSGRYHTGFIAQDVKEAIIGAGLDTAQAAMYIENTYKNDDGTETTECYLRYEEFIALCVYEIQKLKNEIKELKG